MSDQASLDLIKQFQRLRVTDVRDGMDWMGYHHYGTVHYTIRPLFQPDKTIVGVARTARYIPYEGPSPRLPPEEYTKWSAAYYKNVMFDPWYKDIQPGDFVCLDIAGVDVGLMGSNNTLAVKNKGAVGFLLNGGGIRDTDEVIKEDLYVWAKHVSQPMDQARIRYIEKDIPICIGGVAVYPGDIIVADNDGVVVVPRKDAEGVCKYAWQEASHDKKSRKQLYIEGGLPLDETVE
jgi:regulator of RNase E activity RraA